MLHHGYIVFACSVFSAPANALGFRAIYLEREPRLISILLMELSRAQRGTEWYRVYCGGLYQRRYRLTLGRYRLHSCLPSVHRPLARLGHDHLWPAERALALRYATQ